MAYRKILLAVDFAADNDIIIEKAVNAVHQNNAELLLVHVNEPMSMAYSVGPMGGWNQQIAQIQADMRRHSKDQLEDLGNKLNVKDSNRFQLDGGAASEIKRLAEEQAVDLIVLGTHGQHGLGLLLGSTANGVLHGVTCDVLVVLAAS